MKNSGLVVLALAICLTLAACWCFGKAGYAFLSHMPSAPPVKTAPAAPAVKSGTSHWIRQKYYKGFDWQLICNDTEKVIADARNSQLNDSDTWEVFGGNGAGYGEYVSEDKAKEKAEWVTHQGFSHLNDCEDHR